MTASLSPLELARAYLVALGGSDPDAVADLVSADFRNEHQAELGSGSVGQDEYRRRLPGFFAAFPNREYRVIETVLGRLEPASSDGSSEVIVRYRFGADVGEHRIDIPGVMWISVTDGEIVRRLDTWDSLTFFRQTETEPPSLDNTS